MKQSCFAAGPPCPTVCDACIPPFAVDRSIFASLARVELQFPMGAECRQKLGADAAPLGVSRSVVVVQPYLRALTTFAGGQL